MRPQQEVLRRLVTEYQINHDRRVFESILKRVDDLVLVLVYRLKRQFFHLHNVDFSDLYQTAVLGVGEAISTVREEEDGDKITARIIAYIKGAVRRTFKPVKELSGDGVIESYLRKTNSFDLEYEKIDMLDFYEVKCEKHLTLLEQKLIYERFFKGLTYKQLAEKFDCAKSTVHSKIIKILEKIRNSER